MEKQQNISFLPAKKKVTFKHKNMQKIFLCQIHIIYLIAFMFITYFLWVQNWVLISMAIPYQAQNV